MGMLAASGVVTHNALRYQKGCRCAECREAQRLALARYRKAKAIDPRPCYVDATGIRRRLQALACLGYTWRDLSAETGIPLNTFTSGSIYRDSTSRNYTARIKRAYDKLWDKEPEMTPMRKRRRTQAGLWGYLPPLAWSDDDIDDPLAEPFEEAAVDVDWLMVDRAVNGAKRGRRLTAAERQAAMLVMARQGHTATGISNRLGVNTADARRAVEEAA